MTHLEALAVPVCLILILLPVLVVDHQSRRRGRARSKQAEEKAIALLWEWLSPEQKKQWRSGGVFEVIGCDTGTRYLITYATAMNVHQLDQDGLSVAQWCFGPKGDLAPGDVLLVQKIALETMEREVLALANRQPTVHWPSVRRSDACVRPTALVPRAAPPPRSAPL
jgi:hypothetical protein